MKQFLKVALVIQFAIASPAWCASVAGESPWIAKRDPFQIPASATAYLSRAARAAAGKESGDNAEQAWQPQLRAVLYDQVKPLVNIDGQVIGLGDTLRGYRLLQVEEREAVLGKDGQQYRLRIDGVRAR